MHSRRSRALLEGSYFLPRDTVEPSEELKSMALHELVSRLSNARVEIPAARDQLALPASIFHEETSCCNCSYEYPVSTLRGSCDEFQASPPNSTANQSGSENGPQYKLDRSVKTVIEPWDEWHHGRGGKPPVAELNDRLGAQWRLADKTFYSRRLQLIQAIYEEAKRTG
ncbi:hypothetical protein Egran_02144 [Elaphomyces granulatus]|uniref:Transcription activator GCR1-like domain-containing protein n=1 Tax=Elaphomyces granulatus TaxID=519963 RepID=A0A232M137_9EURO|nr:hypothetical protein Egran_02144 [Elaphomyces granulatus]